MIEKLINHLNEITDILVLQCNTATDIGRTDNYTYEKASINYALKILKENGFPNIQVINPFKYNRPLVIGRKNS